MVITVGEWANVLHSIANNVIIIAPRYASEMDTSKWNPFVVVVGRKTNSYCGNVRDRKGFLIASLVPLSEIVHLAFWTNLRQRLL